MNAAALDPSRTDGCGKPRLRRMRYFAGWLEYQDARLSMIALL